MLTGIKKSALCAALFLGVSGAAAQAATVEVTVPFSFLVHGQTLPAGQYRIECDDMDPNVVLIRGEHGSPVRLFVLTMPAAGRDPAGAQPSLTFTRYETQYRLTDIWESGGEGREISK